MGSCNDIERLNGKQGLLPFAWQWWLSFAVLLAALVVPLTVGAAQPVGKVIIAAGDAYAVNDSGERRELRRRSTFEIGDTLTTGADGRLQVRFRDGAMVALQANSQLRIDDYAFSAQQVEQRSVSTLVKGGFRTITGLIGKQAPDAYSVNTPVATIGVRGTHYEAQLGEGLAVAVWQGRVRLHNDAGSLEVGAGAAFNYAQVDAADRRPVGRMAAPPALRDRQSVPAPEAADEDPSADAEAAEDQEKATATDDSTSVAADDEPDTAPAESAEETDTAMAPGGDGESGDFAETDSTLDSVASEGTESVAETTVVGEDTGDALSDVTLNDTDNATLAEPNFVPDPVSSSIPEQFLSDARLTDTEKQRLGDDGRVGIMILSGPGPKNFPGEFGPLTGGVATASDLGPIITTSSVDPGSNNFDEFLSAGLEQVYRPGLVSQLPPPNPVPVSPGFNVEWGAWDASPTNPLQVQTSASDPAVVVPIDKPVFWATLPPADGTVIQARSDVAVFNNVIAAFGHASNNGVGNPILTGDVGFTATIDFNTGLVTAGQMTVGMSPSTLPELWTVNFTGQLNGPLMDVHPDDITGTVLGSFGVHSVEADIGALLSGSGPQAVGGGFSFVSQQDAAIHADGVFLVGE